MDKTIKQKKMTNEATEQQPPYKIPDPPSGFRRIALYKPRWLARPKTHIAGHLLGVQPEEDEHGKPYTAIMMRLTKPADVVRSDELGTREETAAVDEIIAIDASSSPVMEKLCVLARSGGEQYAPTIELHAVPVAGPNGTTVTRFVFFLSETMADRSKVDPVVAAQLARANAAANGSAAT